MSRVLVIGGTGFVGSHVVDDLLTKGYKVRTYSRNPELFRAPLPDVEYLFGDITDVRGLEQAVKNCDFIVHAVSTTVPKTSNDDPAMDITSNLLTTVKLLELAVEHAIKRVVFLSSGGTVYGLPQYTPIDEKHPCNPISSYGIVKLSIEKYLWLFHHLYGLESAILRPSNPYGERQDPNKGQGVIPIFLQRILNDQPITIWGDGETTRDYLHVSDLARAITCSLSYPEPFEVINVGSGVGMSLNEVLVELEAVTEKQAIVEHVAARPFDPPDTTLDVRKIQHVLHWKPQTSLRDGVSRLYEWLRANNKQ